MIKSAVYHCMGMLLQTVSVMMFVYPKAEDIQLCVGIPLIVLSIYFYGTAYVQARTPITPEKTLV